MIVEFRSAEISAIVCSVRSCIAPGAARHHLRGLGQLLRRLELTVGRDDLRPPFPLGLGLARHRPLHLLGQAHVADLDELDLTPHASVCSSSAVFSSPLMRSRSPSS